MEFVAYSMLVAYSRAYCRGLHEMKAIEGCTRKAALWMEAATHPGSMRRALADVRDGRRFGR